MINWFHFHTFADNIGFQLTYLQGTTGFDSKISETVSIPRTEMMTRKPYFNHLNGEDNYALAA